MHKCQIYLSKISVETFVETETLVKTTVENFAFPFLFSCGDPFRCTSVSKETYVKNLLE